MSNSSVKKQSYNVPLWVKPNLSIKEASAYSRIPTSKLYEITEEQDCTFVLWIGSRRMIKRKAFEEYIEKQYSYKLTIDERLYLLIHIKRILDEQSE